MSDTVRLLMHRVYETDKWPFVEARFFTTVKEHRDVLYVVIHTMEAPGKPDTAEKVAKYFKTTDREASAHVCIDSDSVVQCVLDNNVAWAAPGANRTGVHLELAGYAKTTPEEWKSAYNGLLLNNAADVVAQYCLKYDIPVKRLTNKQLEAGDVKGIIGHDQVTAVFRKGTHTDPGKNFPWEFLIDRANYFYAKRK